MSKKDQQNSEPPTWREVNAQLKNAKSEEEVMRLMAKERSGPNRPVFMDRIYGRFNKLRALRERREFRKGGQ